MTGVVLCGGQSSRMGTDKGLIKKEAGPWAQAAFDKLGSLDLPVLISINKSQYPLYAVAFPADKLITDNHSLAVKGPLLGLVSVHLQVPGEDIFVLACDMPLMETTVLQQLLKASQTIHADAFVCSNDSEPEPLCGIYTAAGLGRIVGLLRAQELPRHSMKFILEQLNTHIIPLTEEQKRSFRNFNSHRDWNDL